MYTNSLCSLFNNYMYLLSPYKQIYSNVKYMLYNFIKYIAISALNILYMKNNALDILYMKNNASIILYMKNNALNILYMKNNALNILCIKNNALNIVYIKNNAINILYMKNKVTYIGPFSSISSNESLTAHVLSTLQDSAGADARWNLISTCDCSHSFITMVSSVIEGWKRIFWFGLVEA